MTAEFLALLSMVVVGLPITLVLDRGAQGGRLIGESFLFGSGLASLVLTTLSYAGVAWSLPRLAAGCLIVSGVAALRIARRRVEPAVLYDKEPRSARMLAGILDVTTVTLAGGYVSFALLAAPWEWDFWAIWGLKAKVFFAARSIDWAFLGDRWNAFAHSDYPLNLPLVYDALALCNGAWDDRWMGLVSVAFGIAALLVLRSHLIEETGSRLIAACGALAVTGFVLSPRVGLADVPLIALMTAGLLLVRRAVIGERNELIPPAAVLLGLAALTKTEGIAFLLCTSIAVAVTGGRGRWRILGGLWPAFVIAAVWQIPRLGAGFRSYLVDGLEMGVEPSKVVRAVAAIATTPLPHGLFWIAALAGCLLAARVIVKRERFLLLALTLQFLATVAAYATSPLPLMWQIETSWSRVVTHAAVPLAFLAIASLHARYMRQRESAGSELPVSVAPSS